MYVYCTIINVCLDRRYSEYIHDLLSRKEDLSDSDLLASSTLRTLLPCHRPRWRCMTVQQVLYSAVQVKVR